ncbi:hypothetical protein AX16_010424 [Volvariella volvacea WC 439]|nr:hypothetical protein AX16_010424 [Volvariella volvacea WC 439]
MSNSHSSSSSALPTPKAIASLAKKPSDVTRQGTQKLKFVPTLPARRKKDEVKTEPNTSTVLPTTPSATDRGRGRGRGDGRGGARGRGAPKTLVEMTASGPFALGPALAGVSTRRAPPRSNFPPVPTSDGTARLGANLTPIGVHSLKHEGNLREKGKGKDEPRDEDNEIYSDPDDGVEIVDMDRVHRMDWMAPESLRRDLRKFTKVKEGPPDVTLTEDMNTINALDLSESGEEEELEDIIEDFSVKPDADPSVREERLYFFQFPSPFPSFISNNTNGSGANPPIEGKRVAFAPDTKATSTPDSQEAPAVMDQASHSLDTKLDGVIGQLEIYRSGAVKMRLANDILLDVQAATQPSFLQHAVYFDQQDRRIILLGEVNKRFVVSPDVDALLNSLENHEDLIVTGP